MVISDLGYIYQMSACISITIHKDQRIAVDPDHFFDNVVLHLSKTSANRTPGLELVGISIANGINYLVICKRSHVMNIISIRKLDKIPTYEKRRK